MLLTCYVLQLIDAFASEIGELKQEMVQPGESADEDQDGSRMQSLAEDVESLFLQEMELKSSARDSGYDSLKRKISILDRLIQTHPVWLQLTMSDEEAIQILQRQQPGSPLSRPSQFPVQTRVAIEPCTATPLDDIQGALRDETPPSGNTAFSLEGSGISFADLFRLVAFYCISRDVLPFTLRLPEAIVVAKSQEDLEQVSKLGAGFWNSSLCNNNKDPAVPPPNAVKGSRLGELKKHIPREPLSNGVHSLHTRTPSELECSQTNGALCFVNPLFLEVHQQATGAGGSLKRQKIQDSSAQKKSRVPPPRPPPPVIRKPSALQDQEKQVSMPQTSSCLKQHQDNTMGPGISHSKKTTPVPPPRLKKRISLSESEQSKKTIQESRDTEMQSKAPEAVVSRTSEKDMCVSKRLNANTTLNATLCSQNAMHIQQNGGGRQRLSDMSISTSSSDSLDMDRTFPPPGCPGCEDSSPEDDYGPESDSETMAPPLKLKKKRSTSFVLPHIVKTQFRKVSGVFSSFMTPEKRMIKRIAEVSRDKRTYFGCLVQDYISFLQENKGCHVSGTDMLQTVRQFMTQVKNYLAQSSELDPPIESLIPEDEIGVVLEKAMHKCILKPLKGHIEACLKEFLELNGSWKQLKENLQLAKQKTPQELGVDATAPDSIMIEKIRHKFLTMQKMYSPEKKVMLLLRICKLIYTVMENNSGRMYGADDFLPMLTYVVAQCGMPELDLEIDYMMELLDPSLLHGEGGYYLTSAYGAMSLIKNFQEEQAARMLSSETRNTLHQWHRRRTTIRTIPTVDDFQNYLRVAFQEIISGCTAKTLMVKPYMTTAEVCELCADKFRVLEPNSYALFLVTEETSQQLASDTYPQKIKAELHSRPQPHAFHFVYKRLTSLHICVPPDEENGNIYF
ncbi:RIN2 protein, partial [Polypterus senegalus]